jgi:ABC-type thiamin/hydroxymethylpyrimidine transport system permease subunit
MIREIQKTRIPNKQSSSFIFFRIDAFILRLIQRNCPSHPRVYPLPSAPRDSRQCVSSHRVRGLPRLASPRHMMAATAHHIVSYVYDLSSYGSIASLEKWYLSIGTVLPPFLPRFRLWGRRTRGRQCVSSHRVRGLPRLASPLHMMAATAHHIVSYVYDLSSYGSIASLEKWYLTSGTVLPPFLPRFRLWGRRTRGRQCVSSHRVRGLPRLASPLHMMAATAHHIVSYVYDLSSYGAIASLEKLVPRRSKRLSIGTVLPPFLPRFRLWGRRTSAAGHNVRLPAEGSRLAITPAGRGSKK